MSGLISFSSFLVDGTVRLPFTERTIMAGRNSRAPCIVIGETFDSWITPSGQRITTSSIGRITVSVNSDTYTLNIHSITAQDGGQYRCQGSLNSRHFTLNINCKYPTKGNSLGVLRCIVYKVGVPLGVAIHFSKQ